MYLLVCVLILSGCQTGFSRSTDDDTTPEPTPELSDDVEPATVEEVTEGQGRAGGSEIDIVAYVTSVRGNDGDALHYSGSCPVAPQTLSRLTDEPVQAGFEIAGVELLNELADIPALRLVVPLQLGFIEVPDRAVLRGRLAASEYAECPNPETLFILDEVITEVDQQQTLEQPEVDLAWQTWQDDELGIVFDYPENWALNETREAGAIVNIRFDTGNPGQSARLTVTAGETRWEPDVDAVPPPPLDGDAWYAAKIGPADARLVDDSSRLGDGQREIRLVMNFEGNTLIFSTQFTDGAHLDNEHVYTVNQMLKRVTFNRPLSETDPVNPLASAREELGDGPFIEQVVAEGVAVEVSGLENVQTAGSELVPERDAREAVAGACSDFSGQPEGVWLITVEGITPTGQHVSRLVYVDAVTGVRVCQAELSE